MRAAYHARGWAQVPNVTVAAILREAGAPFESAMGGLAHDVERMVDFAPKGVIEALELCAYLSLPPDTRRHAVAIMWNDSELRAALDTVRRLGESKARAWVRRLVRDNPTHDPLNNNRRNGQHRPDRDGILDPHTEKKGTKL